MEATRTYPSHFFKGIAERLFPLPEESGNYSAGSGWKIVSAYVRRNWGIYLLAFGLILGSSWLAVWIPRLVGRFTDDLQVNHVTPDQAFHFAALIIGISLFRVSSLWIGRIIINGHGRILTYQLRKDLFAKWLRLSRSYYHRHSIGDLLSHALSDVEVVRQFASMGFGQTINGFSMLTAVLYMMAVHMNWHLAFAGLAPLLIIPVIVKYFGPKIRRQSMRYQEALGGMSQMVEEVVGGVRTVKAFGNEEVTVRRFEENGETIVREKVKFVRLSALFGALVPMQSSIGFVVVMAYGGYLTIDHVISLGDFVAFLLYLNLLRMPLEQLGQMLNVVQRAIGSLSRLADLLSVVPDVVDHGTLPGSHSIQGRIEVRNLTFRYPGTDRDVLTNVSFSLEKGKTLGLIGAMGSGKSTLADLLLRLYDPPRGTLFVDGIDILDIPLESLRRGIAYVPQSGFLFSDTILSNVGFSDEQPSLFQAEKATRFSQVHENIVQFPDRFHTEIGERGVRLSGGQKQRVAIARMAYKDSPVFILDDSLSAVDTHTEKEVLAHFRDLQNARSPFYNPDPKAIFLISHRLSAVRHADEILVLEEGAVAERGNHRKLVAQKGIYAQLWRMQSGLDEAEPLREEKVDEAGILQADLSEEEQPLTGGLQAESA